MESARKLTLTRLREYQNATPGVLAIDGQPSFVTLELPWLENARNISCIPMGIYKCQRVNSPKFGVAYHLLDVPERSEILIHAGNTIEDIEGCILLGEHFGSLPPLFAVRDSRRACARFHALLEGAKEVEIEIL